MRASTTIELNPQDIAWATLHAKTWCLFVCRLCTLPGKEGPGCTTRAPPGCGRLNASHGLAGSKICLNRLFQNLGRQAVKGWGVQPQALLSAVLKWALAQESWQPQLSADKACVVLGVLGG